MVRPQSTGRRPEIDPSHLAGPFLKQTCALWPCYARLQGGEVPPSPLNLSWL
jgi:hypothetical protein